MDGSKWKSLLTSRKVWIALILFAGGLVAYVQGSITAEQLAQMGVALGVAVIVAIGVEDNGLRRSGR